MARQCTAQRSGSRRRRGLHGRAGPATDGARLLLGGGGGWCPCLRHAAAGAAVLVGQAGTQPRQEEAAHTKPQCACGASPAQGSACGAGSQQAAVARDGAKRSSCCYSASRPDARAQGPIACGSLPGRWIVHGPRVRSKRGSRRQL